MKYLYPYCKRINLHVKGRISSEDAARQERTAKEILRRLSGHPGVILADEVGMGKTFVALAVAVSVALANRGRRPVAIMVPSSLKEKWPADFSLFLEKCLPPDLAAQLQFGRAERAVQFLKFLDDPEERKKSLLFLTHGAMSRGLNDKWVMLALIAQALRGRWHIDRLRNALCRVMGELLHMKWVEKRDTQIWRKLLTTHPAQWLDVLRRSGIDPEGDDDPETDDDPVPEAVWKVLPGLNTKPVFDVLKNVIPKRRSKYFHKNIAEARDAIKRELRSLWKVCLQKAQYRLPLLILDEAHHLKNPDTRLASLFRAVEAHDDAEVITRGPLAGVFLRMLFLTATPFQLGHGELCSVLDRFEGINWKSRLAPKRGKEDFLKQRKHLRAALDAAQEAAVTLDTAWGRLRQDDLVVGEESPTDVDTWWSTARDATGLTPAAEDVIRCYRRAQERMKKAEHLLRPWVIRHLRNRRLPKPHSHLPRRQRRIGGAIRLLGNGDNREGIPVTGNSLLPFLLAARATCHAPDSRPVFAEGLASSYEAFLHTRRTARTAGRNSPDNAVDADDEAMQRLDITDSMRWYLEKLESLLPREDSDAAPAHPKVAATVERIVDIWKTGEKAVVFCHYVATGRVLRQRISQAIARELQSLGADSLRCDPSEVQNELDRIGKRFFDQDSPIRSACDDQVSTMLRGFPVLRPFHDELLDIVRRNVRTPPFLVRYFPLGRPQLTADAMAEAMERSDQSGLKLRELLERFFEFLVERCGTRDRQRYVDAVKRIQTGTHFGLDVGQEYDDDELQGERPEQLLPNVRLVNGRTRSNTRQRLMLTFNTPFYPEILVASSVMAEGVDLHLNCRYVIHHDLCWNPSTLEQRTGRIDRIGAKAEICGQSIHVFIPFIAETQDEKMYRVVMDRERWFSVVMGEDYKIDARMTEKLANRIPFPEAAAAELAFRLGASKRHVLE